jgi:hypothetical protein
VRWTINAGLEDQEVLHIHGRVALRRMRIQRLLDEALEQGAVVSQEDLAVVLTLGPSIESLSENPRGEVAVLAQQSLGIRAAIREDCLDSGDKII